MNGPSPYQRYLPRLIRYWDEDAPGRLHQAVEGSMVFVDVSGFTKMSERLARHGKVGAEEVTGVIDATFGQLLPEAYTFGANLLKFGGDALLLLFNKDGHASRAAAAAYAMREKLKEVGTFQTTAGRVSLRMSVGVHSGVFDFFLVGRSHRELVVAGPGASGVVDMEGAASAGEILLSPATATALPSSSLGPETGPGTLLRSRPAVEHLEFRPASSPPIDLAQFVPKGLRGILSESDIEPEHRPAAVAFVHYMGFDRLLAANDAETTGAVLQTLTGSVQESADRHGVTFLATDVAPDGGKFILAAGVPERSGNDHERMLLTLRDIVDSAPPELPLQVGVNWGPIFSGVVGPAYRRTYTVMGDVVNLAARLMAQAPPGEIYTTREVLDGSRTTFQLEAPPPFQVKGKKLPIQAFSVGYPEGSRETVQYADLDLIGRDDEMEALIGLWTEVEGGTARAAEVTAEVGMGKSRLLAEFIQRARPGRLVRTECRLYQRATPYFPFRSLLSGLWGLDSPDPAENVRRLRDLVRAECPELEPWLALIGAPLDLDIDESPEVLALESQFRPNRILGATAELLRATVDSPTLMVVENVHWMDEASSDLLAGLTSMMDGEPWMILTTRRPGTEGFTAPDTPTVRRIELAALSDEEATRLILGATEASPLRPGEVETVVERAEGRPFFLFELLEALRGGSDVEALPQSVEGLIGARIDQLAPQDRHLLRRLAVLGAGFQIDHTMAVLTDDERRPEWRARALERLSEFVSSNPSGWTQFRNSLIRDIAYEGLPFKIRRDLHARVGDSIRLEAEPHPETEAELLSLHYFEARRWSDAWRYSLLSGNSAKEVFANLAAATFYQRALAAGRHLDQQSHQRAEVAQLLGDVLEQAGRYDEALNAYRRAGSWIDQNGPDRAHLLLKRAHARTRKAAYAQALRDASNGLRLLGDNPSPGAARLRAQLRVFRATVRMAQQRPRESLEIAERAAMEAREAGEKAALARAYAIMDWAHFVMGRPDQANRSPEAVEIYESLGLLDKAADVINNMGGFCFYMGDWKEAAARASQARATYLRAGNDVQAAMVGSNLGELLVSQRRLDEAEPILIDSVRMLRAAGNQDDAVNAELQMARLVAKRGEIEEAAERFGRVRKEALNLGQTQIAYEAALHLAECHVVQGDSLGALEEITAARDRADEEAEFFEPKRARIAAAAMLNLGLVDEARSELESALAMALELGLVYDEALIRTDRLEMARRLGEAPNPAEADEAIRLLDRLGIEQAVPVPQS
ncbi:MAG: adenylate/guanylate cyclase domain-containing protein [Acidimicrobiia bacterium]